MDATSGHVVWVSYVNQGMMDGISIQHDCNSFMGSIQIHFDAMKDFYDQMPNSLYKISVILWIRVDL